ncbi:hypothetical protein Ddye_005379, partial [Dipteronia dyeriana]
VNAATRFICWKISDRTQQFFDVDFTVEDIRSALFGMFPTKASRPNGFHALSFQKVWAFVGSEVSCACIAILNERALMKNLISTNAVMIPKTKNPMAVVDSRP